MEKKCPKCSQILSSDFFYIKPKLKDGFDCYCKQCRIKIQRDYYKNNSDILKEKSLEYSRNNIEKLRPGRASYYLNNKDKFMSYKRKWKENNKDYTSNRRKSNPLFKMRGNLGNRTYVAFKSKGWNKRWKTEILIGCDWKTARSYIESKFMDGMSWSNYGEWHIDHVIPLSSAKTEEELMKLCQYTNLQPLWAADNFLKGSKII